jgi:hypothetical protein
VKGSTGDSELLLKFVQALNRRGFEEVIADQLPVELRTKISDNEWFAWEIKAAQENPWIKDLETRAGMAFPPLFRRFITSFRFHEFELGPILLFANTGQSNVWNDFSVSMFGDKYLYPSLIEGRFLQFGRQSTGDYDPTCFDMRGGGELDGPIVRIDHEDVLVRNRLTIVSEVAPSFRSIIETFLKETSY